MSVRGQKQTHAAQQRGSLFDQLVRAGDKRVRHLKVIELAQRGIRDPDMLRKMTLKEFGLSDASASAA
jgi:hypothetical protein